MNLNKWNESIPYDSDRMANFSCLLIGSRKSGKSFLVKSLFKKYLSKYYHYYVIACPSKKLRDEYRKLTKSLLVFDYENAKKSLSLLRKHNENRKEKGLKMQNILFILDDVACRKNRYDSYLDILYANGRHENISIIYITQSMKWADTSWRDNSDLIFVFKPNSADTREKLLKYIILGCSDRYFKNSKIEKKYYEKLLREATEKKYSCLVLDCFNNKCYKYKASL